MATTVSDRRETVSLIGSDKGEATAGYQLSRVTGRGRGSATESRNDPPARCVALPRQIITHQMSWASRVVKSCEYCWDEYPISQSCLSVSAGDISCICPA